ncbi:MAG: hypothetical protein H7123_03885 [Thermoleophilia bacterium]|nr:hypothetical protein [Thermoleophilia bacterium]
MADENLPPQSVEESYEEVNRKLNEKLEELRLTAMGVSADTHRDSAADLRPVGGAPSTDSWDSASDDPWASFDEHPPVSDYATRPATDTPTSAVDSDDWSDADLRPVSQSPSAWSGAGFVPDADQNWDERSDDTDFSDVAPLPTAGTDRSWEHPAAQGPSDEQLQFWAQTRTALRLLQQTTDNISHEVMTSVSRHVEEIVRDEMVQPNAAIRSVQQSLPGTIDRLESVLAEELQGPLAALRQLQEELPSQLDRVERGVQGAVERGVTGSTDRLSRELVDVERTLTEGVDQLGRTVQTDVQGVEASVATNVTRMAQGLSTQVGRIERSVQEGFDRVERTLHGDLSKVETTVREELEAPIQTIRQLQDELPARFQRLERAVQESASAPAVEQLTQELVELRGAHREMGEMLRTELEPTRRGVRDLAELDLGAALGDLATAGTVTLDRLSGVTDDLGRDRVQRVEDLELLVDSMAKGWQGVYGAIGKLFERVESFDERFNKFEKQLDAIGTLEGSVEDTLTTMRNQLEANLTEMQNHLQELQPAPVIVTINHPEATVQNTTKGGYITPDAKKSGSHKGKKQETASDAS